MPQVKIDTFIPENRQLNLQLPLDVPTGAAEIIIVSKPDAASGTQESILNYLEQNRLPEKHRRSSEELDAQITEERSAWE